MYTGIDWWTGIRLEVLGGESKKREILRREGIHWATLKKILAHPELRGYRLKEPLPKPKIGPYLERNAQIIEEDKARRRNNATRPSGSTSVCGRWGTGGKYTQVKEAVRELMRMKQEGFMPLIHSGGRGAGGFWVCAGEGFGGHWKSIMRKKFIPPAFAA